MWLPSNFELSIPMLKTEELEQAANFARKFDNGKEQCGSIPGVP